MDKLSNKNSNYQRIEKLLVNAYIDLAKTKEHSQIAVSELCRVAKVNRTTFYKHFRGTWEIKDIIVNHLNTSVERIHLFAQKIDFYNDPRQVFDEVNKEIGENLSFYRSVFKMKGSNMYIQDIVSKIKELAIFEAEKAKLLSPNPIFRVVASTTLGGIITTYYEWIGGNLNCTLDDLGFYLSKYVEGVASALKML